MPLDLTPTRCFAPARAQVSSGVIYVATDGVRTIVLLFEHRQTIIGALRLPAMPPCDLR